MGFSRRKQERKFQSNTGSVAVCSGFDRGLPWRMDVPEKAPGRRFGAVEKGSGAGGNEQDGFEGDGDFLDGTAAKGGDEGAVRPGRAVKRGNIQFPQAL